MRRLGVLVAEDDAAARAALVALVETESTLMLLDAVGDARAAVRAAAAHRPDVAIVDVGMPVGGGAWATREIKRVAPGTRVIAYSGHSDQGIAHEMAEAGASDYIVKGSSIQSILDAIARAVGEPAPPPPAG